MLSRGQQLSLVPTRRGARLVQAGHVISEILAAPGPTHSLFDIMAAAASVLASGPRLALLGFGGGAILAPLRALGWQSGIDAVDLSLEAVLAYSDIAGSALGDVRVTIADAAAWLRGRRAPFDLIVEDLSVPSATDLVMPTVSFDPLPALVAARLRPRGVAIVNVFSPGPEGWSGCLERLSPRGLSAQVVCPHDFDHRLLILGRHLPAARETARGMRAALASIGSRQARRFSLRALP
jgi:hypothetical protein